MSVNWSWYSRLVEEVEKRRVFYDKKHPDYKNIKKKEEKWADVVAILTKKKLAGMTWTAKSC